MKSHFDKIKEEEEAAAAEKLRIANENKSPEEIQAEIDAAAALAAGGPQDPPAPIKEPTPPGDEINEELRTQLRKEWIAEIFGADATDTESAIGYISNLKSSVDTLTTSNETLTESFNKHINPFASEDMRMFNQFAEITKITNHGVYTMVKNANAEQVELDPVGVITKAELLENPDFVDRMSDVRASVLKDLGVETEDELDLSHGPTSYRVKAKATQAYKKIEEYKAHLVLKELPTPEAIQAEQTKKQAASRVMWTPIVNKVAEGEKTYKRGTGDSAFTFDYPDEQVQSLSKAAIDHLVMNGKEPTEENLLEAVGIIRAGLFEGSAHKILDGFGKFTRAMSEEENAMFYHNPSAGKPASQAAQAPVPEPPLSAVDQVAEFKKGKRKIGHLR